MAERSMFWDNASYNGNVLDDVFEYMMTGGLSGKSGVFRGVLNMLAVSGTSSPVTVQSGAACVKGKIYTNSSSISISVPTPASATRIDRIILRSTFAGSPGTVNCVRLAGTEGAGNPALTQTDGATWEIPLAILSITTGGVITCYSHRRACKSGGNNSKGDVMYKACTLSGHYPVDIDMGGPDYDWHLANGDTENGVVCPNLEGRALVAANGSTYVAGAAYGAASTTLPNHIHEAGTLGTAEHTHAMPHAHSLTFAGSVLQSGTTFQGVVSPTGSPSTPNTANKTGLDVSGNTANPSTNPAIATISPCVAEYCFIYVGPNNVAI